MVIGFNISKKKYEQYSSLEGFSTIKIKYSEV